MQTRGAQQQLDCLVCKAKITEVNVLLVSEITVGQRDNPTWHLARWGVAYWQQFWIRLARQKSDPFTSQTAPWGL